MWPKWKRFTFFALTYPVLVGFAIGMKWHQRFHGSIWWWPGAIVIGIPVYLLDVVWVNWIVATVFWGELPDWSRPTYTMRLSTLKKRGSEEAFRQCEVLNKHDPGHC